MSTRPDIDEAQAAVIDQRIGQGFAFLRDVLANPSLVEQIPSGATLRHRDVALDREPIVVRLTAYRTPATATWAALVTGVDGVPSWWASLSKMHGHDPYVGHAHRASTQRVVAKATGETADAALDALEAQVRRATEAGVSPA